MFFSSFLQMGLDTFINYLLIKDSFFINIFVSYDKVYASMAWGNGDIYLNVDVPSWIINDIIYKKYQFPVLETNICDDRSVYPTSLNPYHYSIIHTNYIQVSQGDLVKLKKIIEDVYDRLPSKVDIYRYKNDYDLSISYR